MVSFTNKNYTFLEAELNCGRIHKTVMGPISYNVTLHKCTKTYQGQTLSLYGPLCKLLRK
jgi:hypothetical protein